MKAYFEKIYNKGIESFFRELEERLLQEKKTFIITANPETLMIGKNNKEFDYILRSQDTVITPDGIGVVKGMKMTGYPVEGRVTGVEIVMHLFQLANETEKSVFLLGARSEVISALKHKIENEFSRIRLLGCVDGYVENKDEVFERMKQMKPDIVLVALGIPAQELLIRKHIDDFEKGIFVGVGGSFDVISGMKKRAPGIFLKLNLEWLYRICSEPNRMKRFYQSNIKYLKVIKNMRGEKKRNEKN